MASTTESINQQHHDESETTCSSQNRQCFNSFDREPSNPYDHHKTKLGGHGVGWPVILRLAFQSIGIVYGDLGTSPLYVFAGTFPDGIKHEDDILGAFSLIFYTITLIPLIKYVFIVLKANDNGDGGTFALYSLICRYAKAGFIPSQEAADRDVSNYELETPNNRLKRASKLKSKLEKSQFSKYVLLFATMLGTCMVIGDGILTPCISVLSAVGGIKQASNKMTEDMIVWISVAVLVALFMVQRFGTDKVGYTFAPILFIWFIFIAFIGLYNFIKYDPSVIKALNPMYIIYYFERDKKQAWISLGGTVLSITGAEALFADVGHFTVRSIQLSTCTVIYPAIVLQYMGQSSYLRKHEMDALNAFYKAVPGPVYWPMFVIAVLAAVIASQSLISGTFSIIQQSLSLGCFPRVKIVHTSSKYEGQVYIPEINYLLMLACVAVTLGFRDPRKLGNAYGLAVVSVMAITSSLLVVIMIMIWKTHLLLIISYILIIGGLELLYLTAVLSKFTEGGYLPLVFSIILLAIMYTWNDVYRRKYYYELEHKISTERLKDIVLNTNIRRLPGIAVFYSELVQGIPPIFSQYVSNVPVLHFLLVFVSIKSLPISKVPVDERFLFRPIKPKELNMFRCIVRYGYTDIRNEAEPFERLLVERLKAYMQEEFLINESNQNHLQSNETDNDDICVQIEEDEIENEATERDLEEVLHDTEMLEKAWHTGVVHFVGDNEGSSQTGPFLTPGEVLIAIHRVDPERDGIPLKKVTDACTACFEQGQIFTQQVLAEVLNQLVEQIPLPLLFMRTVLQTIGVYPSLIDFVMNILSRLVSKQIWKTPKLWVGFLRCALLTQPQSFSVLLQLPPPQLENAMNKTPALKAPLVAHASQPNIQSSLPRSVLVVLGIVSDSQTASPTEKAQPPSADGSSSDKVLEAEKSKETSTVSEV